MEVIEQTLYNAIDTTIIGTKKSPSATAATVDEKTFLSFEIFKFCELIVTAERQSFNFLVEIRQVVTCGKVNTIQKSQGSYFWIFFCLWLAFAF